MSKFVNMNNNKILFLFGLAVILPLFFGCVNQRREPSRYRLWYLEPGDNWMTGWLPIGSGSFGAMISGGAETDEIQFNEKTLWTGNTRTYGAYQNFGSLLIRHPGADSTDVSGYERELDLENALAKTRYEIDGVRYEREYFCSFPDSVALVRMSASSARSIDIDLSFNGAHGETTTYTPAGASFGGKLDLLSYYAAMSVETRGGSVDADADGIRIRGASSVVIRFGGRTNYSAISPGYTFPAEKIEPMVEAALTAASGKSYDKLKNTHIADYRLLFDRVSFRLAGTDNTLPTNALIDSYNSEAERHRNLFLEELYFHYGRYLMISCARGIDLPSNLQGIWNNSNRPPWASDIHSNINVQMNYWPAEPTGLSELHRTFLNYIYNQVAVHGQWRRNAFDTGQTKGWTLYTENNIFGWHDTFQKNYVIANAWYCMHLWQHYRYTLDKEFLRRVAFPVMKSCCDYWMERLIRDRVANDGTWVCPNEYSPEHGPTSEDATAHSQQLVWDLFDNTLRAIEVLGDKVVEESFLLELRDKFEHLDDGLAIEEATGQLREWKYSPNSAGSPNHRHLSHLVGLYPGKQISPLLDEDIFNAALRSLDDRGDAGTGWAMGWKINLWARALNGDRARSILNNALNLATTSSTRGAGGVYPNLLDAHPPFQIDGNFGACAGIVEMLLQSHTDIIHLLPALPASWPSGEATGLRAVGNFEVGIRWADGKAVSATLKSMSGGRCALHYPGIAGSVVSAGGRPVDFQTVTPDRIEFDTRAGVTYEIL
jgi:alpha-L-fucosidase 2